MQIDAGNVSSESILSFDICILGAGAAGIALAKELGKQHLRIGLVESGGFDPDRAQQLYDGETFGAIPAELRYLVTSRMRWFGGTTNIWTGWCRPLDDLDFQSRAWVSHSGWPLSRSELEPFYERAAELCEVDSFAYSAEQTASQKSANWLRSGADLRSSFFHFSPPTRFGTLYRSELVSSADVTVILHANVLTLEIDGTGRQVERAMVSALDKRPFPIRARFFALACGGIENARLLLASNSVAKNGIGNDRDLVGRFFMEHPHITRAKALLWADDATVSAYEGKTENKLFRNKVRAVLAPTDQAQRQRKILNFSLVIDKKVNTREARRSFSEAVRELDRNRQANGAGLGIISEREIEIRIEQAPDPENRVVLGSARDSFGMPRAKLFWRMNALDVQTVEQALKIISLELGASASGRVKALNGDYMKPSRFFDRNTPFDGDREAQLVLWHHHMGTTRMGLSETDSVVDANCRVHGIDNLYIAGSSVFPTCGSANPTLTILALALRLADHLSIHAKTAL